jgi:hypothetical protein
LSRIICIACHHIAEIKPLKRGAQLKCSNCGARAQRIVRQVKHWMMNGGQILAEDAPATIYGALLSIMNARGYKIGWVGMKYRRIFGEWPADDLRTNVGPCMPSGELLWWITRESKAYAKERRTAEGPKPVVVERQSALMTADDWMVDL